MIQQSALSLQYVNVLVTTSTGDPTTDVVQMAFTTGANNPTSMQWVAAAWSTATQTLPDRYVAQCLVGPGGTITLPVGAYAIWVQITGDPEIPIMMAGNLKIV